MQGNSKKKYIKHNNNFISISEYKKTIKYKKEFWRQRLQ